MYIFIVSYLTFAAMLIYTNIHAYKDILFKDICSLYYYICTTKHCAVGLLPIRHIHTLKQTDIRSVMPLSVSFLCKVQFIYLICEPSVFIIHLLSIDPFYVCIWVYVCIVYVFVLFTIYTLRNKMLCNFCNVHI